MPIIINPGTGPVEGATAENAVANMEQFRFDLGADEIEIVRDESQDRNGRFGFKLGPVEIDMPGLPVERVRYMSEVGQNIWDFPRLYVDGSSWVWCFAISRAGEALREASESDQ